ncbi:Alpha/Beta hydrolase protein [Mycena sp. CBHHK59/15]|nr:Alpha/Beta hydrolase protein [Mycena sp. CBHHK59/15]
MTSESTPPKTLETLTIPAANGIPTASVILLHGLGGSGRDMASLASHFQADPALSHVQFIFPSAPTCEITASGRARMPAWSDIYTFDFTGTEDERGMFASVAAVEAVVERAGTGAASTVLGGFSQGGGIALLAGLTRAGGALAGLAVLSGRLPIRDRVKAMAAPHATTIPIFYGMGTRDPRGHLIRGSVEFLGAKMGVPAAGASGSRNGLEMHTYEGMTHSISAEEVRDLGVWLKQVLPGE